MMDTERATRNGDGICEDHDNQNFDQLCASPDIDGDGDDANVTVVTSESNQGSAVNVSAQVGSFPQEIEGASNSVNAADISMDELRDKLEATEQEDEDKNKGTHSVHPKRKGKDGKVSPGAIRNNGSSGAKSHAQLPSCKSFNDRHVSRSTTSTGFRKNGKSISPESSSNPCEKSSKLETSTATNNVRSRNEGITTKPLLNCRASDKPEGKPESSKREEMGHPKNETLPAYNFSFKCGERAERRKEFFTKVEQKTNEREAEKTTLQAKSKKTQDAEIRMLRKSLTFRATPMPSFYQEPPPQVELRKIPPTRAKSPKLGRRKSTPTGSGGGEEGNGAKSHLRRASLDERKLEERGKKPPKKDDQSSEGGC